MKKIKIVATIGPACEQEDVLAQMIVAGMDIARFNTKHNEPEWHHERIKRVRSVAEKLQKHVDILLDLQGPEIRIKLPNGPSFDVKKGETTLFIDPEYLENEEIEGNPILIPSEVVSNIQLGHHIILQNGECEYVVTEKKDHVLKAEALDSFTVKTNKSMNTPQTKLSMPSILPKDIAFLESLKTDNIEYVALSFVRDLNDVDVLKKEMAERSMQSKIVAKIETQLSLDNLDPIIDGSDAIMIARGDLAIEIPYFQVPYWQKQIIKKCKEKQKFVITATQMLLSMTTKTRPTRAEVNDVANAVYDGTSAVMLSEETAGGEHPALAVKTQAEIVEYYEQFV